ncbi:hypothetical protein [Poseidonocella sp. HB161398]|uniref:hypothetical protein n=1 Tax=Poseidonocella sp. HB161398 TaxID=2320855 RepID=UPI001107FC48|nr:hypothetical protein [Poseidonocella sp. HB161398]
MSESATTPPAPEIQPDPEGAMPVFVIGLAMAGAISAGAYTAGVVDYLFRAMRAHNRRAGQPGGPKHRVAVKAMSGTSAGGTTAGLIVASLLEARGEDAAVWDAPRRDEVAVDGGGTAEFTYVLGPVYEVWVRQLSFYADGDGLLSDSDLGKAPPVLLDRSPLQPEPDLPLLSLLNGSYLDKVASGAIGGIAAWTETVEGYSFVSGQFDLFLTTTAMNGVSNQIQFGDGVKFNMTQHGLVRHFRIPKLGSGAPLPSPWLEDWEDAGMTLDPAVAAADGSIPFTAPDYLGDWKKFTVASIATGAFPFALPARYINALAAELGARGPGGRQGGALPIDIADGHGIPDIFPDGIPAASPAPYIAVDGGTINNEPFEYARFAIRKRGSAPNTLLDNPRTSLTADRAVVMIDPFPDMEPYTPLTPAAATRLSGLLSIGSKLLSVVISQARFKPTELMLASDTDIRSRFIISPVRRTAEGAVLTGGNAMACGSLNGFGGFLDESFRKHDFLLGQLNCRKFLEDHLVLDPANPVLDGGPSGRVIDPGAMPEIPQPAWPAAGDDALTPVFSQGQARLTKVVDRLIGLLPFNGTVRRIGQALWIPLFRGGLMDTLQGTVMSELLLRGLYLNSALERQMAKARLLETGDAAAQLEAARAVTVALMLRGSKYASPEALHDDMAKSRDKDTVLPTLPAPDRIAGFLDALAGDGLAERRWKVLASWPPARREYRYAFPATGSSARGS